MDVVAQGRLVVADERRLIGEQNRAVLGEQQRAVDRTGEHPFVDGSQELVVADALTGPWASVVTSRGWRTSSESLRASRVASASSSLCRYQVAP